MSWNSGVFRPPTHRGWYPGLRSELLSFPAGKHDDQVDALGLVGQLLDQMVPGQKPKEPPKPKLEAALDYLREGDALVVTKLDRLARSVAHLVAIGERLDSKGVTLKVLDQAIDTSTPTGRLMFNMLGSIAQFERELMLERQREGIARAKAEGKYKGRKPTARAKTPEIKRLMADGIGPTAIARQLGISRASVYRFLA
jgi:DNA invertase Pin-like site-specific DNA recombinase